MAIKVADAFVMVGGDLSKYRADLKAGEKDVQSLGQQIRQALTNPAGFGGTSKIGGLISDLKLGRSLTASLRTASTGLGTTLKGVTANALHSSLNGVKNLLGGMRGLVSDIFKGFSIGLGIGSFQALGRVLSDLVNIIPDLIAKGRDYGRIVDDIGDATGATTENSSKFAGTLLFLGVPLGGVINMLGQMSRNLDEQEPILNKLGVATRDASGALFDQVQILDNARQAFHKFGVGTAQADQIAREFGRGGLKTLVDYLHLTDEQFERITEDLAKQGLILTDAQRDLGESMIREEARFQNALTGLGQTIFTIVGPQIRAFFSSLSDTIQENVTEISNAISNAISFILGLVGALTGAGESMRSFAGSIQEANVVNSPYSAHLLQLRVELGKLEEQQENTSGSTDALRDAITKQIDVIEREIRVLKRQEAAQDTVFKRAIAGYARVYQLRLDALDLAERERENLERQRDLNDQLNQAQLDLIEAQRGESKGGKTVVDAEEVASAMARIAEIQQDQERAAHDREVATQKESLEGTRDYIESIGKLLEDAENKKAALNTLRRREEVLTARQQAQLAAGDLEGAADTAAKIEAIKTAEVRAEEQARNQERETGLERQKELLQRERAAIKQVATDTTAIRKAEIAKQIKDLERLDAQWQKDAAQAKAYLSGITGGFKGEGGLTPAMEEARLAGVKFGEDVKAALAGLGDLFGGIADFLGSIKRGLDEIGESDVWKFLTDPNAPGAKELNDIASGKFPFDKIQRDIDMILDFITGRPSAPTRPTKDDVFDRGGVVPGPRGERRPIFAHGGEGIASVGLMDKLERFFDGAPTPALAGAGLGGGIIELHSHLHLGVREIATEVDRIQVDRRRF